MATFNSPLNQFLRGFHCSAIVLLAAVSLTHPALSQAQPAAKMYSMPASLLSQLKTETQQRQRGECEQKKRELLSTDFYALPNHSLLILMGLPDYFCHSASFMPVTVDAQGNWHTGAVLESNSAGLSSQAEHLWLTSYFEHEAVMPFLHHSTDGLHWQEISLPKPEHIECCFTYLKQVCVNNDSIQLKMTGLEDTPQEYWTTPIPDSLTATPHWQKLAAPLFKDSQCQNKPLTGGDWQRNISKDGKQVSFQSRTSAMTVIMPRWLK